jgi:hypothetical protein
LSAGQGGKSCRYFASFAVFAAFLFSLMRKICRIAAGSFSQEEFVVVFAKCDENIESVRLRGSWMN